jgi:DNA-binding NtrC family response regulator
MRKWAPLSRIQPWINLRRFAREAEPKAVAHDAPCADVDRWPEICRIIEQALDEDGPCRFTSISTPEDAAAVLASDPPDLAIINIVLPPFSTLKLASHAIGVGVRVLLMTGEPATALKLEGVGCPFLAKP